MKRRALCDAQAPDKLRRNRSLTGNSLLSIEEKKRKVTKNLRRLESLGVVDSANQYQEIINEMAKVWQVAQKRPQWQKEGQRAGTWPMAFQSSLCWFCNATWLMEHRENSLT